MDTTPIQHPLANPISQKYAESILVELPEKQRGLHRATVEKMCAMLLLEAQATAKETVFSALDKHLANAVTETDFIESLVDANFPPAASCGTPILWGVEARPMIQRLLISDGAKHVCEVVFRYFEAITGGE